VTTSDLFANETRFADIHGFLSRASGTAGGDVTTADAITDRWI
jgi:hypothetical protein